MASNLSLQPTPDRVPESVQLLDGGAEAFPRMLRAIDGAEQHVHLEIYIFEQDGWGERFIDALGRAARRGVAVTVVVDGWGTFGGARRLVDRLRTYGCSARIYNPLSGFLRGALRRNHRKILVVDDRVAFLGGINIGESYASGGGRRGWEDLALEIGGRPALWLGRRMRGEGPLPRPGSVRIYLTSGWRMRKRYLALLRTARSRVAFAHAYFLPDPGLFRALRRAARRGVQVTLLLAGVSDVPFAMAATRRLYRRLLGAGVQVYEWRASVLHAKAAVADGHRMLLGSFNLDPLSIVNMETLVEVDNAGAASELERWIGERVERSHRVTEADCAATLLQRFLIDVVGGWAARFGEWVARLIAGQDARRRRLQAAFAARRLP